MPLTIIQSRLPDWDGQPWHAVEGGPVRFDVHRRQLSAIESPDEQMAMAKLAVAQVVIETSSYCNRTCVFCPNTTGLRQHTQNMPVAVYDRILDDLSSIAFSGSVLFHLYNEPLADDHIYPYLEKARDRLPKARLGLNTNGDYLDAGVLARLAGAGLRQLTVSIYGRNPGHYNVEHIRARIDSLVLKLGLAPQAGSGALDVRTTQGALAVRVFAQDFTASGYDRGGLVTVGLQRQRMSPCASPFKEILIGYDGSVVPCCNIHPSSPAHADSLVGRVTPDQGIFAVFASEAQAAWRRAMLAYAPHTGPCARCTRAECAAVGSDEQTQYAQACQALLETGD